MGDRLEKKMTQLVQQDYSIQSKTAMLFCRYLYHETMRNENIKGISENHIGSYYLHKKQFKDFRYQKDISLKVLKGFPLIPKMDFALIAKWFLP